jgi:predicted anti-sigma-YlaC factor YlaD
MMDCAGAQEQILEELDRGRALAPASPLAEHIEQCVSCHEFYRTQQWLESELEAVLTGPRLPANFRANLERSIRHEASSARREYTVEGLQLVGYVTASAATAWTWSQLHAAFPQVSASPMQVFHGCLLVAGAILIVENLLRLLIEE